MFGWFKRWREARRKEARDIRWERAERDRMDFLMNPMFAMPRWNPEHATPRQLEIMKNIAESNMKARGW